jgi:predicted Fe-Mo cluster-binding NifX family protein
LVEKIQGRPKCFPAKRVGRIAHPILNFLHVTLEHGDARPDHEVGFGRKANSPSLIADGSQFKADALTGSIVLLALLGQRLGVPLDRIAAAVIAIFIVKAGWEVLVSGMRVLLDASIDPRTLERIKSAIEADSTVDTLKEVTARNSGRYLFVEASVTLKVTDLERAHQASQRIEEKVKNAVPNVDRVLIHYEPKDKIRLRYAVALTSSQKEISQHFLDAPYFALIDVDLTQKKLERQEIVANPRKDLTMDRGKGFGLKLAEFLISYKPDVIVTKEDLSGKCPGYVFAESGVETLHTEVTSLDELVDGLLTK